MEPTKDDFSFLCNSLREDGDKIKYRRGDGNDPCGNWNAELPSEGLEWEITNKCSNGRDIFRVSSTSRMLIKEILKFEVLDKNVIT